MKVLFIGGTGNLSADCTARALGQGHEVFHLNRGSSSGDSSGRVKAVNADIRNHDAAKRAVDGLVAGGIVLDAVVDFIAFTPEEALADFGLFSGICRQFVFLSSASVYTKPASTERITENSTVGNPHWRYAADKLASEEALRARASRPEGGACPALTIVRPSHTYSQKWIPSPFISGDFTIAARILAGKPLVVPGDGAMRWTLTHSRDFAVGLVGLCGNTRAYGKTVQIMSDEAPSWNEIHLELAQALGEALMSHGDRRSPLRAELVHIPIEFIAGVDPESGAKLLGDKGYTSIFDCSLLRSLVPEFSPEVSFARGIRESVAWFLAEPARQKTKPAVDATMDRILAEWKK